MDLRKLRSSERVDPSQNLNNQLAALKKHNSKQQHIIPPNKDLNWATNNN